MVVNVLVPPMEVKGEEEEEEEKEVSGIGQHGYPT